MEEQVVKKSSVKSIYNSIILLLALWISHSWILTPLSLANEMSGIPEVEGQNFWRNIQSKTKLNYSTEYMTPAFRSETGAVPEPTGENFAPSGIFNLITLEHEVAPHTRILVIARGYYALGTDDNFKGMQMMPRDPRIGIRRSQVFDISGLSTNYDLFLQPQITHNVFSTNNDLDLGLRLSNAYTFAGSRWTVGTLMDIVSSYYNPNARGPRVYGFVAPWVSYGFNSKFSTQHWFNFGYKNPRSSTSLADFIWDSPLPFMQHGINWNCTNTVSLTLLLNNYMVAAPTLKNTWASVWFSFSIL